MSGPIVQYVVVRGDLLRALQWPVGAVITQACHASSAALHIFRNDPATQQYLQDLDRMHKIVLEVKDEESLTQLAKRLTEDNIGHKLWIEQPENFPTCLATKPYVKSEVQEYFKKFKLF